MARNTKKAKTINLPSVNNKPIIKRVLPFNGNVVNDRSFSFSFASFDRSHELFNLGSATGNVNSEWFISLLDCFKSVNNMTLEEVKRSTHDLHPINWDNTNANSPNEQYEFWQFRINKSLARVIGILLDGIFYVVWLDPHHNLTNSEGYGGANYYKAGISEYEKLQLENKALLEENLKLHTELKAAEEILDEFCK